MPCPCVKWRAMNAAGGSDVGLNRAIKVLVLIILAAIVIVGFLNFLGHVRTIATITVAAIFLCYVIFPAVRRLNRRLPLWASLVIVYLSLLAIIAATLSFIVPAIGNNVKQFAHDAPMLVRSAQDALSNPNNPLVAHLPPAIRAYIDRLPAELDLLVSRYGGEAASRIIGVVASVVGILALFVVVPIVALYMLLDKQEIHRNVMSVFPPEKRPIVLKILRDVNAVVGGFIRGPLLVAIIVGILITIMLTALHVRYAFLIGAIAGLLEIIPYLGAIAGAAPAVIIALVTNSPLNAALVVLGFIAINQIEGHVISPLVVGESVGLSPLIIVLALLTGGELFGLAGLLLAVPIAGIIKVLLVNLLPRYAGADG